VGKSFVCDVAVVVLTHCRSRPIRLEPQYHILASALASASVERGRPNPRSPDNSGFDGLFKAVQSAERRLPSMSRNTTRSYRPLLKTVLLASALVAVGALVGGGAVWARGTASEISACVEPRTGYLVYGRSCGGASLTWNQQGPAGPQGQAGPQGAAGPKGDPGKGLEPPSAAEIKARKNPPKGLKAATGKPDLAKLAKLKPSLSTSGVWAFSSFHDQEVAFASIKDGFNPKTVSHLDVPAGKYVVVAKADGLSESYDLLGFVFCDLVAGVDSDSSSTRGDSTLALTVVHAFSKPGRIALRCVGFGSVLTHTKISAIRVDVLKNVYVATG
jgi:hypothetical protein